MNSPEELINLRLEKEFAQNNDEDGHECSYINKVNELTKEVKRLNGELSAKSDIVKSLLKKLNRSNELVVSKDVEILKLSKLLSLYEVNSFENTSLLSDAELREIRSYKNIKDNVFVHNLLLVLYKSNCEYLANKTAARNSLDKSPITPDKKKIIENLFAEHVNNSNEGEIGKQKRIKNLNALIKRELTNISTKKINANVSQNRSKQNSIPRSTQNSIARSHIVEETNENRQNSIASSHIIQQTNGNSQNFIANSHIVYYYK